MVDYGLSPRVRGHRLDGLRYICASRSIPTCAGASRPTRMRPHHARVYPHVCGGIGFSRFAHQDSGGLSPRVRGHLEQDFGWNPPEGSIPTCAGASATVPVADLPDGVYPHVCGGIFGPGGIGSPSAGLSPRVRGHRRPLWMRLDDQRSIPTCAGASAAHRDGGSRTWVYPHVCGGISIRNAVQPSPKGLSPRVRGHPHRVLDGGQHHGSIPTCAGASSAEDMAKSSSRVYPHVCGGIPELCSFERSVAGLSPRVRGHLAGPRRDAGFPGSIPTCAGASRT